MGLLDPPARDQQARAKLGNAGAFLGDSTTQQNDIQSTFFRQDSWPLWAMLLSGGRIYFLRNAGTAGDTTAQMLARVDTDVIAYAPRFCTVMGGTNDAGSSVAQATTTANLTAIYAKLTRAGIMPVLCTIVPRNSSTTSIRTAIASINTWVRRTAIANGWPLLDFYRVLVDPADATASYKAGYNADLVHPNVTGYKAMGQHASDVLSPLMPYWYPPLICDAAGQINLLPNPLLLTDANADGVPDSWVIAGNATGGTYTHTLVTDANLPGKGMQIVRTAGTGDRTLKGTSTLSVAPGDKIGVGGVITSDGNSPVSVVLQWTGPGTSYTVARLTAAVTRGVFWAEYTAPASTTSADFRWTVESGTGTAALYQPTLLNMTTYGL